ncbi:ATP-binding protein [Streptomyces sp. SID4985]|uniref:ATP-binding protein n=1 Tax=Streptomyces sp. SID4985 TaxID=2690292 RepID=UPI00137030E8|nr:ATP-binding protein [Streptomyces sp. SID4985]MYQ47248.1 ATP-binding protein [Streptomyces sp. SID4985]
MSFRTAELKRSSLRVPPEAGAVPAARRRAVEIIRGWGLPFLEETIQTFELLAGEVIANAVVHTPQGCRLTMSWDGSRVRLEATDGKPGLLVPPAVPNPDQEHGRGLAMVAALAHAWGSRPTEGGKTVWFELEDDSSPSEQAAVGRVREQHGGAPTT